MKYLFISILLAIVGVGFAPTTNAQQQINNNGVSGSELQQNNNGGALQNAQAGQSTSPVTQNGGAKILQNSPNTSLTVVGEPQPTIPKKDESIFDWVLLAITLLFLLMSPALMYARNIAQKDQASQKKQTLTTAPKNNVQTKTPETVATNNSPINPEPKSSTPKKKHKKSANKVKRGKKKK